MWRHDDGGMDVPQPQAVRVEAHGVAVVRREGAAGSGAVGPYEVRAGNREIGKGVADHGILPVDHPRKSAIAPQNVAGPEVAVEQPARVRCAGRPVEIRRQIEKGGCRSIRHGLAWHEGECVAGCNRVQTHEESGHCQGMPLGRMPGRFTFEVFK